MRSFWLSCHFVCSLFTESWCFFHFICFLFACWRNSANLFLTIFEWFLKLTKGRQAKNISGSDLWHGFCSLSRCSSKHKKRTREVKRAPKCRIAIVIGHLPKHSPIRQKRTQCRAEDVFRVWKIHSKYYFWQWLGEMKRNNANVKRAFIIEFRSIV